MVPAFLTTILFSLSAISGGRCARIFGGVEACFWRLLIATAVLGGYVCLAGQAMPSVAAWVFICSGIVGVGVGDMLFFQALPRVGARSTVLIIQCLSIPIAASIEWLWIGSKLTHTQIIADAIVVLGIAISMLPFEHAEGNKRQKLYGVLFAFASAMGNGLGAVLSRRAYQLASQNCVEVSGSAAAFSRLSGGMIIGVILLLISKRKSLAAATARDNQLAIETYASKWRAAWPWVLTTSLAGQTLGVTCFQWALKHNPTGVVLPILAITPLVTIPLTHVIDRERISMRTMLGATIAVTGVTVLVRS